MCAAPTAAMTRLAIRPASSWVVSGNTTVNSSPPMRQTVSLGAGVGPQDLGEGAQGVVAGGVAERVVDRLWLDDQGITLVGPV
jgi:hypothetical protein